MTHGGRIEHQPFVDDDAVALVVLRDIEHLRRHTRGVGVQVAWQQVEALSTIAHGHTSLPYQYKGEHRHTVEVGTGTHLAAFHPQTGQFSVPYAVGHSARHGFQYFLHRHHIGGKGTKNFS